MKKSESENIKNHERIMVMEDKNKVEKAGRVKVELVCEQCNESFIVKALQTKLGYMMDVKKCVCGSAELTIQPLVK